MPLRIRVMIMSIMVVTAAFESTSSPASRTLLRSAMGSSEPFSSTALGLTTLPAPGAASSVRRALLALSSPPPLRSSAPSPPPAGAPPSAPRLTSMSDQNCLRLPVTFFSTVLSSKLSLNRASAASTASKSTGDVMVRSGGVNRFSSGTPMAPWEMTQCTREMAGFTHGNGSFATILPVPRSSAEPWRTCWGAGRPRGRTVAASTNASAAERCSSTTVPNSWSDGKRKLRMSSSKGSTCICSSLPLGSRPTRRGSEPRLLTSLARPTRCFLASAAEREDTSCMA
mmetsp:Transcript_17135/g.58166  ORF Transcript_17135/g.58166 Transcript_17135/m.58166 type:complete len:284 (+) Transcript_17135:336-1187(+)